MTPDEGVRGFKSLHFREMLINCPNCDKQVEQQRPPARNDPHGGDAWPCLKCPVVVCVWCYMRHIEQQHPELYRPKPKEGNKKRKKK